MHISEVYAVFGSLLAVFKNVSSARIDLHEECYRTPAGHKLLRYNIESNTLNFEWTRQRYVGSCTVEVATKMTNYHICSKITRLQAGPEFYISIWEYANYQAFGYMKAELSNNSAVDVPVCARIGSKLRIRLSRILLEKPLNITIQAYTRSDGSPALHIIIIVFAAAALSIIAVIIIVGSRASADKHTDDDSFYSESARSRNNSTADDAKISAKNIKS